VYQLRDGPQIDTIPRRRQGALIHDAAEAAIGRRCGIPIGRKCYSNRGDFCESCFDAVLIKTITA